ncbi:response regulator [Vibrio sinensis]|uniref:histidine kinase n=1 Tax=Vibrio sinensis TaxID=2302434 RepID=A0A3A6QAW0_9VIBR|nr:ATP-binding protein [Vibrio sinensis]RJX68361.1 response regulator [Vibrio sinensis]
MDKSELLQRKLQREKSARHQAEMLLEQKSLELYEANEQLKLVLGQLERQNVEGLRKLEFEAHINKALIYFGRAFLTRTLDDGLLSSLLRRLSSNNVINTVFLRLDTELFSTIIGERFGDGIILHGDFTQHVSWQDNDLFMPLSVENQVIGELVVNVGESLIERDFIASQIAPVVDLLCSALSRQIMMTNMQEARNRAEESERSTKEFVAMINHELRTPLNALLGSAELLHGTDMNEEQQEMLKTLSHSGDLLRHIINDLLDFSKMNAGMMDLIPTHFSWPDLRNTMIGIFEPITQEKGIEFFVEVDSEMPTMFFGDFERICQILVNLIGNAIKFTAQGEIKVRAKWHDGQLRVSVSDTGVGITQDAQTQLFDPFVQADRTAKRNYEGTGLGLAICQNLVSLMDGNIKLTSELGKGSEFVFIISLSESDQIVSSVAQENGNCTTKLLENLVILVVDDIRMNQIIITQMLGKMSVQFDIANNGVEALQAIEKGDYDIVFMDCRMPEMDGFEATTHLRSQLYQKPIIALTAGTTLEEREKCMLSGMDDILTKPYTARELKAIIEKWM